MAGNGHEAEGGAAAKGGSDAGNRLAVIAVYQDRIAAGDAVGRLVAAGFETQDLSVVAAAAAPGEEAVAAAEPDGEQQRRRAGRLATLLGGIQGVLLGLEASAVGAGAPPLVTVGSLAGVTLFGAASQRLAGSIESTLEREEGAAHAHPGSGRVLVIAHAADIGVADRAHAILAETEPLDLQTHPDDSLPAA